MVINLVLMVTSILAIIGVGVLAFGYRSSLFSDDPVTRFFAWSMALLALSVGARRLMWDVLHPVVLEGNDHRPINVLFNIIALAAIYAGLRARLLLIPEDERRGWRWWNAWSHPGLLRFNIERNGRK